MVQWYPIRLHKDHTASSRRSDASVVYAQRNETHVMWTGGSSGWQAPEQLIARSGGDARQGYSTDVFSYGMLLFYCLTAGRHPFGHHYERDFNILQVSSQTACSALPLGSHHSFCIEWLLGLLYSTD
jgi:serine/threonine protein kinase